jgi:hypothetical protein
MRKLAASWFPACAARSLKSAISPPKGPIELLLCIADHFEPGAGGASAQLADDRVNRWVETYPRLFSSFRDSDGHPPQHTFFYPLEMYRKSELARLSDLCRDGFGEVEVHLHHDNDNAGNLRATLDDYCRKIHQEHGLLTRDRQTGQIRYGFAHGNWALNNSHPSGQWCGVDNELAILRDTGCYADFTFPSYPSPTQPRKINGIYYGSTRDTGRYSLDFGRDVGAGSPQSDNLMLIQGPLVFNWHSRKFGLLPRIENGNIQESQPPAPYRIDLWLSARVQIPSRPDWYFVKLHAHGAPEPGQRTLLGKVMQQLHEALAQRANVNPDFRYHYVSAREMYNLVRAAEANWRGSVNQARDFELPPPSSSELNSNSRKSLVAACQPIS